MSETEAFRNFGDYGIEAPVSKSDAESVCSWAEEFIETAESCLRDQP